MIAVGAWVTAISGAFKLTGRTLGDACTFDADIACNARRSTCSAVHGVGLKQDALKGAERLAGPTQVGVVSSVIDSGTDDRHTTSGNST